jgi:CubicO group peptidase (beta-lactamase class C family)
MTALGLPKADRPKEVGLSAKRLARRSATFREDVERNMIPGAVVLIVRGGHIGYAEAFGWRDREAKAPMELDAIFRIASMTKPLTSVAAMIRRRANCRLPPRSPSTSRNSQIGRSAPSACLPSG